MEEKECKGCAYSRNINGKLYCTFQGFVCAIEFITYCQKNEREED